MTLCVVAGGSALMWTLYGSTVHSHELPTPPYGSAAPLVIGIGRTPGGAGEWVAYARVFAQLQRDLERPVVLRYALNHPEIERLVAEGEVDIALVPIYVYLKLQESSDATLVAAPSIAEDTRNTAVLAVAADSDHVGLEDLRGGRIVMTRRSLAGRPFAQWLLLGSGENIDDFFGSIDESDAQDLDLGDVANGRADAACVSLDALAPWPEGTFRVLVESPTFGMPPVVARAGLDRDTIAQVRRSLTTVELRRAEHSALSGFVTVSDTDYAFARTLARLSGPALPATEDTP